MSDDANTRTLNGRFDWVKRHRRMSFAEWAKRAGLSVGFLGTARTRAKRNPEFRPDYGSIVKLAVSAGVTMQWLRDGEGDPESSHGTHPIPSDPKEPAAAKGSDAGHERRGPIPWFRRFSDAVNLHLHLYTLEDVTTATIAISTAYQDSETVRDWLDDERQPGIGWLALTLLDAAAARHKRGFRGKVDLQVLLLESGSKPRIGQ